MESLEIMKLEKLSALNRRETERLENLQKKKIDVELNSAENEKLDVFNRIFSEKHKFILDMLEKTKSVPKEKLPETFNDISKEINNLQKYVANSSLFLRNYDLERCQNVVQDLNLTLKEFELDLLPKKKFTFKNKSKTQKINTKLDEVDSTPKKYLEISLCGFSAKKNEILVMSHEELLKKDITLTNLENCKVYLQGTPSTLHLNHLKNCFIFSGPVSTSIFAENCIDSTLIIACQQLRLHSSKNIKIYLHVTSRAIMEDCREIEVAPYNWSYDGVQKDFEIAGLDTNVNNWRLVDDFDWLNEKHSPNWREMDKNSRVVTWNDL